MWFDSMVIPKDAPNADNAHKLIDFLLRPDVAGRQLEHGRVCERQPGGEALIKPEFVIIRASIRRRR